MSTPDRKWIEVRARVPDDGSEGARLAQELIAAGMVLLGGRAVEERDGWSVTHLEETFARPEGPGDDPLRAAVAQVRESLGALVGGHGLEVEADWRPHEDWAETWRRGIEVRRLGERIVVRPSWLEVPDPRPGDLVITVDPKMAFGNAEHGTTRGCVRLLGGVVASGERVLDVGSGSGILAIAAALLGAGSVHAVEGDPLATEAIEENIRENGVADRVTSEERLADVPWLEAAGPADGVVANIESGILRPLLPGFAAAVRPGGWLILSGILDEEWPEMRAATEAHGFRFVEVDADGAWRSGLFRRN